MGDAPKSDTWMAFYVGDYVANTLHLTTRQHGAYILLICAAWKARGVLPGTDTALASIAKLSPREWRQDGDTLKAFLTRRGEEWIHERVMYEWNEARVLTNAKSDAGKLGAKRRWQGRGGANGSAMAEPSVRHRQNDAPSPSPSPSPSQLDIPVETTGESAPQKPKGPRNANGTRIPEGWRPDEAGRSFAAERGIDPDATADAFIDWWAAATKNHLKRDWNAAFRTWCRRDSTRPVGAPTARAVQSARGDDPFFQQLASIAARDRGGPDDAH